MLEKIKSFLDRIFNSEKARISSIAVVTAVVVFAVALFGNSIYTVNIFDGNNKYTIRTNNSDIKTAVSKLNINCNYNIEKTAVRGKTTNVEISYHFPVHITCGDKTVTLEFDGGTVGDALKLAGYTTDKYDLVYPSIDTVLTQTTYIDYTDIGYISGSYTEKIPYSTETSYSSNYGKGVVKTIQKGVAGEQKVDYTQKVVNGVAGEKTVVAKTIITDAVNQKNVVGTKISSVKTSSTVNSISVLNPSKPIELDENGNPVNYTKKMTCRATAYTYTGNNCSTGVAPKPGYIAVNPKVIPYGTKLYIKSADGKIVYGYAIAADTGGFIKKHPTGIDLFLTSESACQSFGVRNMEVYVIG